MRLHIITGGGCIMEYLCLVVVMFGLVWLLENCNGLSTYPVSLDGQTPVIAAVKVL